MVVFKPDTRFFFSYREYFKKNGLRHFGSKLSILSLDTAFLLQIKQLNLFIITVIFCFVLEKTPTLVSNPDSNEGNEVELRKPR